MRTSISCKRISFKWFSLCLEPKKSFQAFWPYVSLSDFFRTRFEVHNRWFTFLRLVAKVGWTSPECLLSDPSPWCLLQVQEAVFFGNSLARLVNLSAERYSMICQAIWDLSIWSCSSRALLKIYLQGGWLIKIEIWASGANNTTVGCLWLPSPRASYETGRAWVGLDPCSARL